MSYSRRSKPKPLKDLIGKYLDDIPYRKELKRGMILSLWPRTVGKAINEQVRHIRFEGDKLIINVANPAWRNEIHMNRFSIAKKLNDEVKEKIIKEIIVRS